jgi:hypothetical protein
VGSKDVGESKSIEEIFNMSTIYKYKLSASDPTFYIMMPAGSEIVHVAVQHGSPYIWAEVDTQHQPQERRFRFVATGQSIPEKEDYRKYIGTFLLNDGDFVIHLYEIYT